jgi:hypothetical protein
MEISNVDNNDHTIKGCIYNDSINHISEDGVDSAHIGSNLEAFKLEFEWCFALLFKIKIKLNYHC